MSRMDKLNQQFKREISTLLLMGEIRDPRVAFVTITFADISRDLSCAHIGYSVFSDDPQVLRAAQEGLNSASGRVRKLVGERVGVRHIPEIRFVHDDSIAQAVRMNKTLESIQNERAQRVTGEGEESGKQDN
ncbi:MAG: 30S ribosome-binding factor RbfA [Candidatus Omnitrophica bacterium]|nr:30S ribosome-binding factor RbfA [Candidatus Omnitrophota bacterium]